jgi:AraC-like DNA-binding protein
MLSKTIDAGTTSRRVGYLSVSQFSREYARFFGSAPIRDIARLRKQGLTAADVSPSLAPLAVQGHLQLSSSKAV